MNRQVIVILHSPKLTCQSDRCHKLEAFAAVPTTATTTTTDIAWRSLLSRCRRRFKQTANDQRQQKQQQHRRDETSETSLVAVVRYLIPCSLAAKRLHPAADTPLNLGAERKLILRNTRISRHHMAPEIALHLITQECSIYHQPIGEDFCFRTEPFWGFFWPGGQALTRFILDNKQLFAGKRVLDVGCGCGASAIAARLIGANAATANDIDPTALQAALLNAELNSVDLEISSRNLIGQPCDDFDVVLIGDLFYDAEIASVLSPWLAQLAAKRKNIYIGDPGRHGLTEKRLWNMTQLARYRLPPDVCIENNGFSHASVWEFKSNS
ncbi:electron transfer flavoprotein beta subunit lysine methyltransferase-like [Wyeomyia smithii]|uniref:electron transfer flavoprotein beta subunit lysine methyltransferase-like n=1 Tax=Wyeomyia smithii TaxID=174621 RepID=UPI002467F50C|nr:electron transfer flavoprotein beta subunit lysine methyltransferase-like [Wyeomyia smithii]